jgi:hypothetical protein
MQTQTEKYDDFDFTKKLKDKVEKQSYTKLTFIVVLFVSLLFAGYVGSNMVLSKAQKQTVATQQQKQLLIQDIKQMSDAEFTNMLEFISLNVGIYDAKVTYVQEIVVKADAEEMQTITTHNATDLGNFLTEYKNGVKQDVAKLMLIRKSVSNNIDVSQEDVSTFFNYMGAYKSKMRLNDTNIDNRIHKVLYDSASGNQRYNKKNNVFERIKEFDNQLKSFQYVATAPKLSEDQIQYLQEMNKRASPDLISKPHK